MNYLDDIFVILVMIYVIAFICLCIKEASKQQIHWIKIQPGCELPDLDCPVLWRTECGHFFWIDIDHDNDWENFKDNYPEYKLTHWAKVPDPKNM
jgi:hypothetical protein